MSRAFSFVTLIALLLAPVTASALSCRPWRVADAADQAITSDAEYLPVVGWLTFDETLLPVTNWDRQQDTPPLTRIPATFRGLGWNGTEISTPIDREITLEVACAGPWCGGAVSGHRAVAFLKKDGAAYSLQMGPCGGMAFWDDVAENKAKVEACLRHGGCDHQPATR